MPGHRPDAMGCPPHDLCAFCCEVNGAADTVFPIPLFDCDLAGHGEREGKSVPTCRGVDAFMSIRGFLHGDIIYHLSHAHGISGEISSPRLLLTRRDEAAQLDRAL